MHLPDGVLSNPVAATTWVLATGGVVVGLRRLDCERIPRAGVLGAVFFVSTLIAIPFPPASVHLLLSGLMGMVLGWAAFPAILLALALQAIQFGHGGISSLGANTLVMAVPAVLCGGVFARGMRSPQRAALQAFLAGAGAVVLACLLQALLLCLTDRGFLAPALALLAAHVPVIILDGLVTAWVIAFLHRVRPEMLAPMPHLPRTEACP